MTSRPFPIYDVFLDIPHPAVSTTSNANMQCGTIIIAPPPGPALKASMAVGKELVGDERAIARMARFAFPDFNDSIWAQEQAANPPIPNSGAGLNKFDIHLSEFYSPNALTSIRKPNPYCTGSSYFTFALQLTSGARVHGHVKRYMPHHNHAKSRIDVGRRAARALVLLTRGSGGEQFYSSLLKTIEGISSLNASSETEKSTSHKQAFLHRIFNEHQRVGAEHASKNGHANDQSRGGSQNSTLNVVVVPSIEFQSPIHAAVDMCKFVVPTTLLHSVSEQDSITSFSNYRLLPLLRCLGISETLRLLSALLCERRIILLSRSPARLSGCARAALSVLAQGLLYWQHIFVPILPPGMITHLAAPMPYLVGLMSNHASVIPRIPGIGEVLIIDLDTSELTTQNIQFPDSEIPDLMRPAMESYISDGEKYKSVAENLAQDLVDIAKADKKLRNAGENVVAEKLGNAAGKGKVILKKSLAKLKMTYSKKQTSFPDNDFVEEQQEEPVSEPTLSFTDEMYAFGEGYENEAGEEEARIAFASFFLTMIGDVKWFLRAPSQAGEDPTLDKVLFMQARARFGDVEGSAMYPLLTYFRESQLFEEFVKARIQEIRQRKPLPNDAPVFSLTANYLRVHRIDFSPQNVRRVIRQASDSNPSRYLIQWNADVKRRAMSLTSNSRQDHLVQAELVRIVNDCREGSSVLIDVMGVIWNRLQDCKGMQWKHGLYAFVLLRELLLHGPLVAIIEASDGLNIINKLKYYENSMRSSVTVQLRRYAYIISDLLMNRSKLFSQRKAATQRRFELKNPPIQKQRIPSHNVIFKFAEFHRILAPNGAKPSRSGAKIAPNRTPTTSAPPVQPVRSVQPVTDLLDFASPVPTPTIARIPVQSKQSFPQNPSIPPQPHQQDIFNTSSMQTALPPTNERVPSNMNSQSYIANPTTQPVPTPPTTQNGTTMNNPFPPLQLNHAQQSVVSQNNVLVAQNPGQAYNAYPVAQQSHYGNQPSNQNVYHTQGYHMAGQQNTTYAVLPPAPQTHIQQQPVTGQAQFSQVSSPPPSQPVRPRSQFDPFA